jgi:FixJ family two-component response regulator
MPQKPVISIVDDDPSVRAGIADLLDAMGFTVETFRHADEFLEFNRLRDTSCLIADVRLPGMTGLDLYHHLLWSGRIIPTILITAFPDDDDRARALQAGVHCYLTKPFKDRELSGCIHSALGNRRANTRGP